MQNVDVVGDSVERAANNIWDLKADQREAESNRPCNGLYLTPGIGAFEQMSDERDTDKHKYMDTAAILIT